MTDDHNYHIGVVRDDIAEIRALLDQADGTPSRGGVTGAQAPTGNDGEHNERDHRPQG